MSDERPTPGSGRRARRSLGQNFLIDPNLQRKIVAALDAGPDDEVLEIGPGRGALTRHLAGTVGRLTLVELDPLLAGEWRDEYADRADVTVLHRDVLELSLGDVVPDPSRLFVVGNIPYNITTPILFHLLQRPRPARIVLMVQREVADRITSEAGTAAYGALAVGVQSVADVRLLFGVSRSAFRPVPGVDSAVIEIVPHTPPRLSVDDEHDLRTLTRAVFQWRRKQLQKTLRDHVDLQVDPARVARAESHLGIDLTRRAETLTPGELLALTRVLR